MISCRGRTCWPHRLVERRDRRFSGTDQADRRGPRDLGLFDPRENLQVDTLNQFEHWWATPVQFVLLFFGLANAGVPFEQVGSGTYFVLAGLLLGKASRLRCRSPGAR
ncbi:MAG: hypothetical protein WBC51_07250 [Vicinamibacterales bacterium]